MRPAQRFAAAGFGLIACLSAARGAHAQCVVGTYSGAPVSSIGLVTTSSAVTSSLSGTSEIWSNCGNARIPSFLANQSAGTNGFDVTINHVAGASTRDDGACAEGAPTTFDAEGRVTGGEITVWDTWGSGTPPVDCRPLFGIIIAHELGHVLGLGNSTESCPDHLMGTGVWSGMTSPHSDECDKVAANFTPPSDPPDPITLCDDGSGTGQCSPIIVNLGSGPYTLSGSEDPVEFDIDGDGAPNRITWTARGSAMAFLALDRNGNRRIDDGSELFGNWTPLRSGARAVNGFEALKELDSSADAVVDVLDAEWSALLLWTDVNHDGVSQPEELQHVAASRVRAIGTHSHWTGRRDAAGNFFGYQGSAYFDRGPRPVYDVYFRSTP